jgi:hypothetical protein
MSLLLLMGDSTPSIGSLFASGEAGLALNVEAAYLRGWIFQDSAGATVAAAAGDPVGLILDTARGGLDNLGSELVTNGDFSTSDVSAWSAAGNVTAAVTGGVYSLTADAATTGGRFLEATTSSNAVLVTFRARRVSGTSAASYWGIPRTGGFASPNHQVSLDTSGNWVTYRYIILRESGATGVRIYLQLPAGNAVWEFDDVSIKAVPGNHAYQTTSGSRPALARTPDGGRRNLLTYSEALSNAAWQPSTISNGTSVNGVISLSNSEGYAYVTQVVTANTSIDHVVSLDVTCDQTVANVPLRIAGTVNVSQLVSLTAGVTVRVTLTGYRPGTNIFIGLDARDAVVPGGSNSTGYNVTFNRVQLETGSSATAYQRVGLTSDVTESGKRDCWGLLFDGSDDSLQTASVDFSATDKMTVMAGVRKNTDASYGCIVETGTSFTASSGSFGLWAGGTPTVNGPEYHFNSRGAAGATALQSAVSGSFASPVTNVVSATGNISGDLSALRVNGAASGTNGTADQGAGNYTAQIMYIGARAGSSFRFNGIIYTLIIRGATTPTGTIADFEKNLLAKRAGTSW